MGEYRRKLMMLVNSTEVGYLCFTSIEDGSTVTLDSITNKNVISTLSNTLVLYTSTDGYSFDSWDGSTITLNNGECIYVYGDNTSSWVKNISGTYYYPHFSMTGKIKASGNLMSLFNKSCPQNHPFQDSCNRMFMNNTSIITPPDLPSTGLMIHTYYQMFYGCTALTRTPELPATVLTDSCYYYMFYNCTSLTQCPVSMPVETVNLSSCFNMFRNCTSLTNTPDVIGTSSLVLRNYCFANMFNGCTSITTAPELPSKSLANYCYNSMFSGCYTGMFQMCSRLSYIKAMFVTDITSDTSYTSNWVNKVASSGTFVKNTDATWDVTGVNGIPENWSVQTAEI